MISPITWFWNWRHRKLLRKVQWILEANDFFDKLPNLKKKAFPLDKSINM